MFESLNFVKVYKKVDKCCLGKGVCNHCKGNECLVGFSKNIIINAMENDEFYVDDGVDKIPTYDLKGYEKEDVIEAVGQILKQCKNCKLYHDEECIVNVTRSALEHILTGDNFEYKGSAFVYLNDIKNVDPELGDALFKTYMKEN
ncbi:hypothetical protein [Natranaerobius trueperi]|uniref:Uncharacterized protein n=1 Tax=Natranaerobius trueperi TaxID=759412 RepID=A0A226BY04_9FIRM|nr:hypothetical protein [Natranaerobius trueperi]OWZ83893.1 hypothetical protein CDO51_05765 [Natranaerobius trueperi]